LGDVINPLNPVQMKKTVKTLVLFTILSVFSFSVMGQLKLPVANGFTADMKKVIEDYPSRFIHIMGEVKVQHEQTTEYECNLKINGAEEATITRYSSKRDGVVSWDAVMFTTDDFEDAKKKYKSYFSQLNNLGVTLGKDHFRLRGVYEIPADDKKFNSILFTIEPTAPDIKKVKVELTLQYKAPMDWQVKVLVYDREREDGEQGRVEE
jgi:hypothetical protein